MTNLPGKLLYIMAESAVAPNGVDYIEGGDFVFWQRFLISEDHGQTWAIFGDIHARAIRLSGQYCSLPVKYPPLEYKNLISACRETQTPWPQEALVPHFEKFGADLKEFVKRP